MSKKLNLLKEFKNDLPASIVVFFVALPLCLGIALASGAPMFSGIIAGIVGGIIVGAASGSSLGVSGPAAGLAVIVFTAINQTFHGDYETFLLAVVFAGIIQVILGFAKAGIIGYFLPNSVIKGMLAGIGILIIIKQIPHAVGFIDSEKSITPAAAIISSISLIVLVLWEKFLANKHKVFQVIQGPIAVVILGVIFNYCLQSGLLNLSLAENQMVKLPVPDQLSSFFKQFTFPNFSSLSNLDVYKVAFLLAIVGSLETLLSVEATDKLDPEKRVTPTNRELKAQGLGNIISGLIGGLPITQVIVRSSANISFGAKSKLSAIMHGFFLLMSVITIVKFLNMIPLASLAAILLMVGYKLAKPSLIKSTFLLGWSQFIPFIVTIMGMILTDLLKGVVMGAIVSIFFILKESYHNAYTLKDSIKEEQGHKVHHISLAEEVTFLNKSVILNTLNNLPAHSHVIIDCSNTKSMDHDVVEIIENFIIHAKTINTKVETINFSTH